MEDYKFIPIEFPVENPGDRSRMRVTRYRPGAGLISTDGGMSWFDFSDPFRNELALLLSRSGDDWTGTLMLAGLPCMLVMGGGSMGDGEYERYLPRYDEPEMQHLHAMFCERVIGDIPREGEEYEWWPFPHGAMVMVLEKREAVIGYSENSRTGERTDIIGQKNYDLYDDLYPEVETQGYEITELHGIVARSMYHAEPEDLTAPRGF